MCTSEAAGSNDSNGKQIKSDDLISLYEERWKQIRHLDVLDLRSIALVVTAIIGVLVQWPDQSDLSPIIGLSMGILAVIILFGGIYSTIRNRESMEITMSAIDSIESSLEIKHPGLFPSAGNYTAPEKMREFTKRVIKSIRGPIVMFYAAAIALIILAIIDKKWQLSMTYSIPLAILLSLIITLYCFYDNWIHGKHIFVALNKQT